MNKVHKKTCVIGFGILVFAFMVGGFSMAQQALSTDLPNGSDDSVEGNLTDPGFMLDSEKVHGYFSTREGVTLHGKKGFFYADDADIVRTKASCFGKHLKLFFKGVAEVGLYSIDALDVEIEEDKTTGDYETEIIFSVRKDQIVWDADGHPLFIQKNDVVEYEVDEGCFQVLFKGDLFLAPRIDGVSVEEDECNGDIEEYLYISTAEDWLFNSPSGMFYVYDEDIVRIPLNSAAEMNGYEVTFRGKEYGITTLDAFDRYEDKLFISVLVPVHLQWPTKTIYAEDGDVVCMDVSSGPKFEKIFKGELYFIYTIDGLAVEENPEQPE